jgi:hypothetical protein
MLTEVECRMVANIEERFQQPQWMVYPHVDYPQVHLWLARRSFTPMAPLVVTMLGDLPGEISFWLHENTSRPNPWGNSST